MIGIELPNAPDIIEWHDEEPEEFMFVTHAGYGFGSMYRDMFPDLWDACKKEERDIIVVDPWRFIAATNKS